MVFRKKTYQNQQNPNIAKIYKFAIIINIILIFISSNSNFLTVGSIFAESNKSNEFWSTMREPEKNISNNPGVQVSQVKPQISTGSVQTGSQTNKNVPNYFSYVFKKNVYDVKVVELQKLLASLGLFKGKLDGIFNQKTMESLYSYQLARQILTTNAASSLKGYPGPTTRTVLNKEYALYVAKNGTSQTNKPTIKVEKTSPQSIQHAKKYFQSRNFVAQTIAGTGVMVGNTDIDMSALSGKIDVSVLVASKKSFRGTIAQVKFKEGTVLRTEDGNVFSGILKTPEFVDVSEAQEIKDQEIVSVVDVGGYDEELILQNTDGSSISSKVKMPAPGAQEGETVVVNYSQDGTSWSLMGTAKVFLENGSPYVEFDTTHFTLFSIGLPVGSFVINNDALSTTGTNVKLDMNVAGATDMRFSNTEAGLSSASWVSYATGYDWAITTFNGTQTVYAQFSGLYGTQSLSDSIIYDNTSSSNLLARYNGTMNGTNIIDNKGVYPLSGFSSIASVNLSGEQTLYFNGTSQYGQRTGAGITAYPFTFSAWVNPSTIAGTDTIISIGNGSTATSYWALQLVNGAPSIVARNTSTYTATYGGALSTGKWYQLTAVFSSATVRRIYLNGSEVKSNTSSVTFANTNQQLRIGRLAGSTSTNYFHGYIDEARVYNKALTVDEIIALYQTRAEDLNQYLNVGSFAINNDSPNVYTSAVVLHSVVTGATLMRFSNTEAGLSSASWVSYASTYSWNLISGAGNKTVYAEFTDGTNYYTVQDNIFLETVTTTPLKFMLSSAMNGTKILDSTTNIYDFTGYNSLGTVIDNGEEVLAFNGTSKYADRGSIGITAYPFTISTWIKAPAIAGTDGLVMIGNSASTTAYFGLQLTNGIPQLVARNTAAYTFGSTSTISTGAWYHIVGVFASGTSRSLYVNGILEATNTTSVTFTSTNQQVRLGRFVGSTTNYYSGYMDDTRVYASALTLAEIKAMYTGRIMKMEKPTAKVIYSTTAQTSGPVTVTLTGYSEPITITNNGGSNQYVFNANGSFTFLFKDADGNIGSTIAYVDWIESGSLTIDSPTSFSMGSLMASAGLATLETSFSTSNDYFKVQDTIGSDAGYYTTISFSDIQKGSDVITKSNIYIKTLGSIVTLNGSANSNVVSDIGTSYVNVASPLSFIKRNTAPNSLRKGTYGAQLAVKVDVPGYKPTGTYMGTITYTIYEN